MAGLSYKFAAKIAWREMRSSLGKFLFVVLSVAIGVAALVGVRSFSSAFRGTLLERSRSIMAADLSARTAQQPTLVQTEGLNAVGYQGIRITPVTELLSMAAAERTAAPQLVSVKAVDPSAYPFYGTVQLEPAGPLANVLNANTIVVAPELLTRMALRVGDQLKIGTKPFTIAALVINEPDRLSGGFIDGPRVLMSRQGLTESGLLIPGTHADQRYLFKFPAGGRGAASEEAITELKLRLARFLPDAQITDYRETNPELTTALDQATSMLSLIGLVAVVLGAVGVAMAMRAHLVQRLDTIAVMRSLGATSSEIIKIHLLQTLSLGIVGSLLGVILGIFVQLAFPALLGTLVNIRPPFHLDPHAILVGLAAGVGTTLLFSLPPLLDIRNVSPSLILRRAVDTTDETFAAGLLRRFRKNIIQILALVIILISLSLLAARISNSSEIGKWFAFGLIAVLLVLFLASFLVLGALRLLLAQTRLQLPSTLRHGLANLYRPGNPSASLLAALGIGVMQIMIVFLTQHAVVQRLQVNSASDLPNLFLIDIANDQIDGMRILLQSTPGIITTPELLPIVSSHIMSIDGTAAGQIKMENINLTYMDDLPAGATVTEGSWWTAEQAQGAPAHAMVAVAKNRADNLGIHLGSTIKFATQTKDVEATVAAFTKSDGQHAYSRADFILPRSLLGQESAVWYGGVRVAASGLEPLKRDLYTVYPTVTVVDVAQALETVRSIVVQTIKVVQFLAAFSIFAGAVILASAIAGTRFRRIRETVVLKTLGASRARVISIFSIEFAVLGLVAGLVGIVFANVIVYLVLRALGIPSRIEWLLNLVGLVLTAGLAIGTGWIACLRILSQKPLEILREE